MQNSKIGIVVPVYEDVEAATILFQRLAKIEGLKLEIFAIDDGSVRCPLSASSFAGLAVPVQVIQLRRNVGHQMAIAIGLNFVHDNVKDFAYVVVMDSDGEDRPESIPHLVEAIQKANSDVVVATRKSRVESLKFKTFYVVYKWLFSLLVGRKIGFGNFMVLTPAALDRLVIMPELKTHLAACVLLSKLRVAQQPTDRGVRYADKSKMNFVGLALHGFRAFMVFAEDVLVRVGLICTSMLGLVVLLALVSIGLKIAGLATPGWLSLVLGTLGVLFLQFGALALMALMNLMLTGMIRSGIVVGNPYKEFIKEVEKS